MCNHVRSIKTHQLGYVRLLFHHTSASSHQITSNKRIIQDHLLRCGAVFGWSDLGKIGTLANATCRLDRLNLNKSNCIVLGRCVLDLAGTEGNA